METLLEIFKSDNFIFIFYICIFILLTWLLISLNYINKNYLKFMKKIGNGNNLDEMLKEYLNSVEDIRKDNMEIKNYYTKLDNDISSSIQKVGLVRYNAFQDVGSDLSFALALLDRENNGIILNGIYGSESSNIYAKPIKNGESQYQLSEEEKEALKIASQDKNFLTQYKEKKF